MRKNSLRRLGQTWNFGPAFWSESNLKKSLFLITMTLGICLDKVVDLHFHKYIRWVRQGLHNEA
jgi:hypothetical protein